MQAAQAGGGHGLAGSKERLMQVAEKICGAATFPADAMHSPSVEAALQLCAAAGAGKEALQP
eukprot:10485652-Lingulodinium_polyedra.AAC.1